MLSRSRYKLNQFLPTNTKDDMFIFPRLNFQYVQRIRIYSNINTANFTLIFFYHFTPWEAINLLRRKMDTM